MSSAIQVPVQESCPLCHGREQAPIARYTELTWVRCGCGLIFKSAEAPGQAAETFYESDYHAARYDSRVRRRVAKSRRQIRDILQYAAPGPLLDIGCSYGYTLLAARSLGLEACGADVSRFAVEHCARLGFEAHLGSLQALPFADGRFAAVTLKHVLEHTREPRNALAEVRRVLKPRGVLFVAVPDARYGKSRRNPQASGYYVPARHGVEHFVYYTPVTATRLLGECGYQVLRINTHLVQRAAPSWHRMAQAAFAPLRLLGQLLADGLTLRKEFWLIARRSD